MEQKNVEIRRFSSCKIIMRIILFNKRLQRVKGRNLKKTKSFCSNCPDQLQHCIERFKILRSKFNSFVTSCGISSPRNKKYPNMGDAAVNVLIVPFCCSLFSRTEEIETNSQLLAKFRFISSSLHRRNSLFPREYIPARLG